MVTLTEQGPLARVRDFMTAFDYVLSHGRRFVSLHDARAIPGWTVADRAKMHEWLKRRSPALRELVIAHGAIVTGVAQRTNAAAAFWGTGLDKGVCYFEDVTAAEVWAFKAARSSVNVSAG